MGCLWAPIMSTISRGQFLFFLAPSECVFFGLLCLLVFGSIWSKDQSFSLAVVDFQSAICADLWCWQLNPNNSALSELSSLGLPVWLARIELFILKRCTHYIVCKSTVTKDWARILALLSSFGVLAVVFLARTALRSKNTCFILPLSSRGW